MIEVAINVVFAVCAVMLGAAGIMALLRAEKGPTMLNRTLALDVFATVIIGGIALEAAYSRRTDTLPILVGLSLVGFVGSVTIARFASHEPVEERRVLTAAEIARDEERRRKREEQEEQS